jgi:hypothetical protein
MRTEYTILGSINSVEARKYSRICIWKDLISVDKEKETELTIDREQSDI